MNAKTMKVKQNSFRKLDDPFENGKSKKYIFYVKTDDIAEGIPMATNPREQKLTSSVATAIQESLVSNDGYFHLKNRGIVVSAANVRYDNAGEEVTIVFTDSLLHGDIDGGHTYKIACLHKGEGLDQYVQFEVMTGVEDIIEQLAEARNTSIDVDTKSLAELAQRFDPIKEALEGMPFFSRIAFKQNQTAKSPDTGKALKMIDARDILKLLSRRNLRFCLYLHFCLLELEDDSPWNAGSHNQSTIIPGRNAFLFFKCCSCSPGPQRSSSASALPVRGWPAPGGLTARRRSHSRYRSPRPSSGPPTQSR